MTVRDHLGRSLAVGSALAVLGVGAMTMTERALAVAPPATAGANGATLIVDSVPAQNNKTLGPLATATPAVSTITVPESAQSVLRDVDVRTFIKHTGSGDLDIELTSPVRPGQAARTVKLILGPDGVRNDAGGANDVFDGTLWDDSSLRPASDLVGELLGEVAPQADLTPEGALGKFVGIDPRGTWTLRVADQRDTAETVEPDGGMLVRWALELATQDVAPVISPTVTANSTGPVPIADSPGAAATSSITVSGAKPYLFDLDLVTNITHTSPGDLEILLSHGGRTALIGSAVNGGTPFYSNRTFDDSAPTLLRLATDTSVPVVPEGALAAFRGMDPNGVWTLSVQDKIEIDTGTINSWQLKIGATEGTPVVTPPVTPPVVTPPVVTPPVVTPPVVTPQATKLGLKRFGLVKNAKKNTLKLNVAWLNGTGRVNYTATLSTKLGKKTVRKVVKGSGVAGPKAVSKTVKIPKTWKGKKVTVRLVVKNSGTSLVRTKTIRRF